MVSESSEVLQYLTSVTRCFWDVGLNCGLSQESLQITMVHGDQVPLVSRKKGFPAFPAWTCSSLQEAMGWQKLSRHTVSLEICVQSPTERRRLLAHLWQTLGPEADFLGRYCASFQSPGAMDCCHFSMNEVPVPWTAGLMRSHLVVTWVFVPWLSGELLKAYLAKSLAEAEWDCSVLEGCGHSPFSSLLVERKRFPLWLTMTLYIRKAEVSLPEMLFVQIPSSVQLGKQKRREDKATFNTTMQIKPLSLSVTQSFDGFHCAGVLNSHLFLHCESWCLSACSWLMCYFSLYLSYSNLLEI